MSQARKIPVGLPIEAEVELAPLTTLGVGGMADYLGRPKDVASLVACVDWAEAEGLRVWWLGGGSNVVIADQGLRGLVIQPQMREISVIGQESSLVWVRAEAGCVWDDLVQWSVERGLAGIECLSGIPGHVGAAPIQNIGAYGQELREVFVESELWDREARCVVRWEVGDWRFGYRESRLKQEGGSRYAVLAVVLGLWQGKAPLLRYRDVQAYFAGRSDPSLREVRDAVLTIRRQKSMVWDLDDPNARSAGSFFTNPVILRSAVDAVRERLAQGLVDGEQMPVYPTEQQTHVKLSAAWLIERCGMPRGYGDGTVGISQRHTLALINRGGASASEVMAFARHIQQRVQEVCGVCLQPEPIALGFEEGI